MAITADEVKSTLSLIEDTRLPHPSGPLLKSYVQEALNPLLAARYVKNRLEFGEGSSLVADWYYIIESITQNGCPPPQPDTTEQQDIIKRDGGKCCVTGKAGTLYDPLIVAPILPVPYGWNAEKRPSVQDMLGAFFGPPYWAWWLSYVKSPRDVTTPYHNHWLIRMSAARAFASGLIRLNRSHSSLIEYELKHVEVGLEEPIEVDGMYPLLGDHSRSHIVNVDPRFVGSHARLCESIQLVNISKKLSHKKQSSTSFIGLRRQNSLGFSNLWKGAFFTVWRWLPSKFRMICYEMLQRIGERLYGMPWYDGTDTVQRLPFGLYLKHYRGSADLARNEFNALRMVHRHTAIPVPEALDVVFEQEYSNNPLSFSGPTAYLLMTRVPGFPLWRCQNVLSESDLERIANQLKNYIAQLRNIPRCPKSDFPICNTLGEACRDYRIRHADPVGPFADEAEFSQVLRYSDDPARRGHNIFFTHADLNARNILADKTVHSDGTVTWNVSAIVDWETAGYYPEYWEYTKAMQEGFRWSRRHNDMIHKVFSEFGDYSKEMNVELEAWASKDAI
ncbi:kinase-like domain-containing protein [Hypoxylon fragiforme]|uniref:kinase-like domain-containing protein n=1 Tax=Hypoxylon fragiforme TaxID=63214 RepID=UPI0020C70884|nr:kinase-like domain-containing protein [Hypoxylon fragiforme]KAI2603351.1 kinase-like domain-containing protein [Hypoxylon fragiforme]